MGETSGGGLSMRSIEGVAGLLAVVFVWFFVANTTPEEKDTASSSVNMTPINKIPYNEPEPEQTVTSDRARQGQTLVQRDMAKRFAVWLFEVNRGLWGAAVSDEVRQQYADIQNNASEALLAYEDATDFYSGRRGFAFAAVECRIRSKEWSWSVDDKLNRDAARDATLQATKNALSEIERRTGDAFSAFMVHFYAGSTIGKDREEGCHSLATMPFMVTFDRYEAGLIDKLPRLGSPQ